MSQLKYLIILLPFFISCEESTPDYNFPYNIHHPDEIRKLPKVLREISGLSIINSNQIACVQDEAGIIYIYDWQNDKISKKVDFQVFDDFEGVEIVNGNGYALTSKGDLYEIPNLNTQPNLYPIKMPAPPNFEGLGYDKNSNQLLIVPKEQIMKGKMLIFKYDIDKRNFDPEPFIQVSTHQLKAYFEQNQIPYKLKKKFPFSPSGIAVHPMTNNIYVLADSGKTLAILSPKGKIQHIIKLDKRLYPKPEGIAFFKNGDLLIASEGNFGRLVRINYSASSPKTE